MSEFRRAWLKSLSLLARIYTIKDVGNHAELVGARVKTGVFTQTLRPGADCPPRPIIRRISQRHAAGPRMVPSVEVHKRAINIAKTRAPLGAIEVRADNGVASGMKVPGTRD